MSKVLLFTFLILFSTKSFAEDSPELTPIRIKVGLGLNGNIYSSDFRSLNNVTSCCDRYESAFGIGIAPSLGFDYLMFPEMSLFKLRYNFNMVYSDYSADYSVNKHIGYLLPDSDIGNQEPQKIMVEYSLKNNIKYLMTEHWVQANLLKHEKFHFGIGFQVGFPLSKEYEQAEILKSPDEIVFANGTDKMNESSGDIPDALAYYAGIAGRIGYDILEFDNFTLGAESKFGFALTNVTSAHNWKIHNSYLGLSLAYSVPKKVIKHAPPILPPAPELPVEPAIVVMQEPQAEISVTINDVPADGTRRFRLFENVFYKHEILPPFFFFEPDDLDLKDFPDYASLLIRHLWTVDGLDLTLRYYALESQKEQYRQIAVNLKNYLVNARIDHQKIKIEEMIIPDNFRYPELRQEAGRVEFIMDDNNAMLYSTTPAHTELDIEELIVKVNVDVDYPDLISSPKGQATLNNTKVADFGINGTEFNLFKAHQPTEMDRLHILKVEISFENQSGKTINAQKEIQLSPAYAEKHLWEVYEGIDFYTDKPLIISLYEFDKSTPKYYDKRLLGHIKKAANNGETILIMPLNDGLGTVEYNQTLMQKRAESVINLIGIENLKYEIIYPEKPMFDLSTPNGRIMSRSVMVKVK